MFDFHAWVVENNLEAYEETLKAQDIDTKDMLAGLTTGDLLTMGITSLGGQKKIMNAVQKLKSSAESHTPDKMIPYVVTAIILLFVGISIAILVFDNVSEETIRQKTPNMKYYSDLLNGYSGVAGANYYMTNESNQILIPGELPKGFIFTRPLEKLSKEERFLIWKALNEYSLKGREVYYVTVKCDNSKEFLNLLVEIYSNGKGFSDYGGCYAVKR
ncbi:MAG: hypothetical protein HDR38_00630 [Treponema sp.]|nr:hypothetical protein [Treponema sp.]